MLGIAAVGFAFVLLLGGIDLSIGSSVTLVNIVGAWLMVNAEMNPVIAIVLVLIMATAIGFVNGWIISNIQMPPLIVTLAMMIILEGLAYMVCQGLPIYGFPAFFWNLRTRIFRANPDSGHYYDHRSGYWFVYIK